MKKRGYLVEFICALFILLFVYTGINKIIAFNDLKTVLKEYPFIGTYSVIISWLLPAVEIIVSICLFIPRTKLAGLYMSLVLMVTFTVYLISMLSFTTKHPCTCGGMLQTLSWSQHLVFNIFFVLLAIIGIWLYKKNKSAKKETTRSEMKLA